MDLVAPPLIEATFHWIAVAVLAAGLASALLLPEVLDRWPLPDEARPALLRGRWAVRVVGPFLVLLLFLRIPEPERFCFYLPFTLGLLLAARIDLCCRLIPNRLLLYMLLPGVLLWPLQPPALLWAGPAGAAGLLLLMAAGARSGGIGYGDVKLAGVMGFYLGPVHGLAALTAALITGGLAGVLLLASGRLSRGGEIPFGPFLALGGWAMVLFSGGA